MNKWSGNRLERLRKRGSGLSIAECAQVLVWRLWELKSPPEQPHPLDPDRYAIAYEIETAWMATPNLDRWIAALGRTAAMGTANGYAREAAHFLIERDAPPMQSVKVTKPAKKFVERAYLDAATAREDIADAARCVLGGKYFDGDAAEKWLRMSVDDELASVIQWIEKPGKVRTCLVRDGRGDCVDIAEWQPHRKALKEHSQYVGESTNLYVDALRNAGVRYEDGDWLPEPEEVGIPSPRSLWKNAKIAAGDERDRYALEQYIGRREGHYVAAYYRA